MLHLIQLRFTDIQQFMELEQAIGNDNGVAFDSVSINTLAIFPIFNIFLSVQAWSGSHFRLQLIEGC